ncbi:hypothetical protein RJT34_02421 [Clitoria ternatea]|uniref:Uncharacterized protein n=1 Tax=Clitoria ternatea TaxID=43366 RepID=A0AAN9KIK9_CLITE
MSQEEEFMNEDMFLDKALVSEDKESLILRNIEQRQALVAHLLLSPLAISPNLVASDFIREVNPDIIIGYNICKFDLPYLIEELAFSYGFLLDALKKLAKALNEPIESLFEARGKDTWLSIRELLKRETEAAISEFFASITSFETEEIV